MRKIRVKEKKVDKAEGFFESKKKMTIAGVSAAVVLIIIVVLLLVESTDEKIVVNNRTDLKLEYVKAYFVGPEDVYNDGINVTDLGAGEKEVIPQEPINLLNAEANLEVRFKFEGSEEMFVDAGYYNDNFAGKITIDFSKNKEGKVILKVKAKPGVLNSPNIIADDRFTVNLETGEIED